MTTFDALMAAGMAEMTAQCGEPVTIAGTVYSAIVSELSVTREMEEAGYQPGFYFTFVVSLAQMPTVPNLQAGPVYGVYQGQPFQLKNPLRSDSAAVTLYGQNIY